MIDKIRELYFQYRYLFDKEVEVFTIILSETECIIEMDRVLTKLRDEVPQA